MPAGYPRPPRPNPATPPGKLRGAVAVGPEVGHPLDNPLWTALTGPQAHLAIRHGHAARFPADVSPFAAVANPVGEPMLEVSERGVGYVEPTERRVRSIRIGTEWADLAVLAGPGGTVVVPGAPAQSPPGWESVWEIPGVQMEGSGLDAAADPEAVPLGPADVPEMLDLVARTRPGPFLPRTITLGTYLGIRRGGVLVAMAGERMRPPGWGEISAVCTDPAQRGQGLAGRLVRAVGAVVRERGDVPFLHAAASNTAGIRLYERLGFTHRRDILFGALWAPAAAAPSLQQGGLAATRSQ
jgi:ribosomal protein S18 acetylase RimI-like enzyme